MTKNQNATRVSNRPTFEESMHLIQQCAFIDLDDRDPNPETLLACVKGTCDETGKVLRVQMFVATNPYAYEASSDIPTSAKESVAVYKFVGYRDMGRLFEKWDRSFQRNNP